jgi:hypothetical protein
MRVVYLVTNTTGLFQKLVAMTDIIGSVYRESGEENYIYYNTPGSLRNASEGLEFPRKTTRNKHFWEKLSFPIPWPWFRQLVAFFLREDTDSSTGYYT